MGEDVLNFIGGEFREAAGRGWLENVEPGTGRVYGRVAASESADVDAAVSAARGAFAGWSATPASERMRVLMRLADLIDANTARLARAESVDQGKPMSLARELDIPRSAVNFRFFASAVVHGSSEFHDTETGMLNYTLRRARGVAGLISPWNLPLYLLTWKIAPALATGNTVVAKPSELTPMTASILCELSREAGLGPGVLNVVQGTGAGAGRALVMHPEVPAISFTGGTATGRWIAEHAGPMFKGLSLELGGKNSNIIFDDCDLETAALTAVRAAFTNQGEICLCGSRVLVQRRAYEEVVARMVAGARALKIGDPLEAGTEQGALVSAAHREKVHGYVELARKLGGKVRCGGERVGLGDARIAGRCAGGFFYEPTVITDLDPACAVQQEEIFGPVVTVTPFETDAEAIALANSTPYGLAAMVWTKDLSRAHRVAAGIEAGVVWVNCWMVRDLRTPFGGVKQSGLGREGGWEAVRFFTEPKSVGVRL